MTLDPISALSVAAATAQFIEFSKKLVCKSAELVNSLDGVLRENRETETVTMRLQQMAQELQLPNKSLGSIATTSARLQSICTECNDVSVELLGYLHRLKIPDGSVGHKWKSFRHALKSVWSKKGVDGMAQKLSFLRSEIDTEVLVLMRDNWVLTSSEIKSQLDQHTAENREIKDQLLQFQSSHDHFLKQFEGLNEKCKAEFERLGSLSIDQNSKFQSLDEQTRNIIAALTKKDSRSSTRGDYPGVDHISGGPATESNQREAAATLIQQDGEKRASRVHLNILESLRFPEMSHRQDGITEAHAKTFQWIFKDPTKHHKPWDSFHQWLCQGSGVYWIQGKPASGKSTLMSYICYHNSTTKQLEAWANGADLITGAFFFWNSGSAEQQSQAGLFRTLLYEVLKDHRHLISRAFPEEWAWKSDLVANDMTIEQETWSQYQLEGAFKRLIGLSDVSQKFCFFIDGLDEYDGDYGDIAEYFRSLSEESHYAKFCFSSRPLPVIQEVFHGVHGLKLQDLTADDIRRYVEDKLENHRQMQQLIHLDPTGGSFLIQEIVQKASGVFLWVTLVVKSLINGLRNGDDMTHLRKRLFSLPPNLEQLFEHTLEKIEREYKDESSKIFQIFRTSGHELLVKELYDALLYDNYRDAIALPMEDKYASYEEGQNKILHYVDYMTRRLNSRCRGLLEVRGCCWPRLALPASATHEDDMKTPVSLGTEAHLAAPRLTRPLEQDSSSSRDLPIDHQAVQRLVDCDSKDPMRTMQLAPPDQAEEFQNNGSFKPLEATNNSSRTNMSCSARPGRLEGSSSHPCGTIYHIAYLHRTARDYLEQPHVWRSILECATNPGFDPKHSLLMAHVVKLKASPGGDIWQTGSRLLHLFARLNLVDSPASIELVTEIDTVLNSRWRQTGHTSHWSDEYQSRPFPSATISWEGDITSMAIQCGLLSYAQATAVDKPSSADMVAETGLPLPSALQKKKSGLPLLAYAAHFHSWALFYGYGHRILHRILPCPSLPQKQKHLELVEHLLRNGYDPNEEFQGYSIWEYILHQVHYTDATHELAGFWLPIFMLSLQHGANPHACCVDDSSRFREAIGLEKNRKNVLPDHIKPREGRGCDSTSSEARSRHVERHSVTAVIEDVFKKNSVPGFKELQSLLEAKRKKSSHAHARRKRKNTSSEYKRQRPAC